MRVPVLINYPFISRFNYCDDAIPWHDHHLDPGKLIIDAACVDLCQLHIVGHHIANFVQRLLVFAACVDLRHTAFVEGLAPCWRAALCSRAAHAEIPQVALYFLTHLQKLPYSISLLAFSAGSTSLPTRRSKSDQGTHAPR